MHFEILVEDSSGKKALDILIPKIIDMNAGHTSRVHSYKGSGHIPRDLQSVSDPSKRILLERLPKLIQGYDRVHLLLVTFSHLWWAAAVIIKRANAIRPYNK